MFPAGNCCICHQEKDGHTKDYEMQELSSLRTQIPDCTARKPGTVFFHPPAPLLSPKQWLGEAQFTCGTCTEVLVTLEFLPLFSNYCAITDLT